MAVAEYTLTGFDDFLEQRRLLFVDPLHSVRVCSLCGVVPARSFLLPCCHVFCEPCKSQIVAGEECPLDGRQYEESNVVPLNFKLSDLGQHRICCPNVSQNCSFVGQLCGLKEHLQGCVSKVVKCAKCHRRIFRQTAVEHYRMCPGEVAVAQSLEQVHFVEVIGDVRIRLEKLREGVTSESVKTDAFVSEMESLSKQLGCLEMELLQATEDDDFSVSEEPKPSPVPKRRCAPVPFRAASKAGSFIALCKFLDVYTSLERLKDTKQLQMSSEVQTLGGYTFKLSCELSKDEGSEVNLRFLLNLRDGMWDTYVDWPFAKKVVVLLTHPRDQEKDVRLPLPMEDYKMLKKPMPGVWNWGNWTKKVPWKGIELAGFIDNRVLYANVEFE
ncbi:uncharacterized protein LOC144179412 [Haemaphysalis longicornis]